MDIIINTPENNNHIHNLAYVRALLIRNRIEQLGMSYENKQLLFQEVLEYLKNNNK